MKINKNKSPLISNNYSTQYYFVDVLPVWLTFKLFVTFDVVTCAREEAKTTVKDLH